LTLAAGWNNQRMRRRGTNTLLLAALVVTPWFVAAGCDGDEGEPTSRRSTTTTTGRTTTSTSTAPPTGAAPDALRGRWQTTLANGEAITFTIQESTFQIRRGPGANGGSLQVHGDTMSLTTASCEGVGEYRWSVEGDRLTITLLGEDSCPNRSDALAGSVFQRER
jgi:hypothetical protein